MVVVFDFGLGQRCLFNRRPHDRLGTLIERAVHQEFLELLGDDPFGAEVHRQVWVVPRAGYAKAFEFLALHVDPAFSELAAFLAKLDGVDLVFVETLGAVLFLDLPFDGKAVAIPSGDIARVAAHHLLGADDHILEDLVQRVADMQVAVRVGRAVVQCEGFSALGLFAQAVINAHPGPFIEPFWFTLRQTRPHREVGFRQVQRVFIVGRFGAHLGVLGNAYQSDVRGSARVSIRLVPAARIVRAPGM